MAGVMPDLDDIRENAAVAVGGIELPRSRDDASRALEQLRRATRRVAAAEAALANAARRLDRAETGPEQYARWLSDHGPARASRA